jgi:hypothetical protein
MPLYGDKRDQMHPGVARAVPNTPEALTILRDRDLKPATFGDLVSCLTEMGVVPSGSFEEVQGGVCGLLGIPPQEFINRLHMPTFLESWEAAEWIRKVNKDVLDNLVSVKEAQAAEYFSTRMSEAFGDSGQDELGAMITKQASDISELDSEIASPNTSALSRARAIAKQKEVTLPFLEALKSSRYAVSLPTLIEYLRQDPLLQEGGKNFAEYVVMGLGHKLSEQSYLYIVEHLDDFFEGHEEDYFGPIEMQDFRDTWVAEAHLGLLAQVYAHQYYEFGGPGRTKLREIGNPVEAILYVLDEEEQSFFEKYPLAHNSNS